MNATKHPDRCLDAETLAAWFDGGLDAAAVAAAEAHVSNCDRCQVLVATMMKTLPAEAATAPAGVRLWRWWLAPIAAATAAVVIWAVVPQRSLDQMAMQAPSTSVVAPEPARSAAAPETASPAASPPPVVAPQAARPRAAETPLESLSAAREAPATRDNAQGFSPVPGTPPAARRQQELAEAAKRPSESDRLAAVGDREARADAAAPATPPAPRASAPPAAPLPATTPPAAAPAAAAAPVPAAPPTAVAEAAPAREENSAKRAATAAGAAAPADLQLRARQAAPIEIVSPDPARRWRVSAEFAITQSEDGGRSWRQVRSAEADRMTAGSSPSRDVCWFVGRNGLVLLTTDGARFTRIAFPAQADLIGVTAINARTATVVTGDGRTFSTDDGGRTWRQN